MKTMKNLIYTTVALISINTFSQEFRPRLPIEKKPIELVKKRALLVMIENGGYKDGLPFEIGSKEVRIPTGRFSCGGYTINVSDPNNMVNEIANFIRHQGPSTNSCLNPARITENWHAETKTRTLAEYIRSSTDYTTELLSINAINAAASAKYDKVIFLQNSQFNAAMAISVLNQYRVSHVFDIHTLAHGSKTAIVGGNSSEGETLRINKDNFFSVLARQVSENKAVSIRAVYQMNCYGRYLLDEWSSLGVKVANGSRELNWMPLGYSVFLQKWLAGERFDDSVLAGYRSQIPYLQVSMTFLGRGSEVNQMVRDSEPFFIGNISLRIND